MRFMRGKFQVSSGKFQVWKTPPRAGNSKPQPPSSREIPNTKLQTGVWTILVIGAWGFSECWLLVLGAYKSLALFNLSLVTSAPTIKSWQAALDNSSASRRGANRMAAAWASSWTAARRA
jgi:hypothetical protein